MVEWLMKFGCWLSVWLFTDYNQTKQHIANWALYTIERMPIDIENDWSFRTGLKIQSTLITSNENSVQIEEKRVPHIVCQ